MTLNNIISYIQTMAESHKQIKSFFFGLRDEWLSNGDIQYPAMFVELKTAKVSRITRNTTYSFVCVLADLSDVASHAQENEFEVESDLTQIAEDMVSLMQFESDKNSDFQSSKEVILEYFTDTLEDIDIAVGFQFDISTRYAANRCQVPTNFISPNAPTSPFIMANYSFRNDVPKTSFTINSLKNKQITLLLVDGESPLQVAENPSIDEYSYNVVTGEFIFGKEIQSEQVVQILNRSI